MPDAGSTGEEQPPPKERVEGEISLAEVVDEVYGIFGVGEWQAGGGGTGGKFMFASIADLDQVISQWETERQAIQADNATINDAAALIGPPAHDDMSVGQADATRTSLLKLAEHNKAMLDYANEYIKKLQDSRTDMVNTEQANAARLGKGR